MGGALERVERNEEEQQWGAREVGVGAAMASANRPWGSVMVFSPSKLYPDWIDAIDIIIM